MSDYRAIGGVSATLQVLLRDRLEMPLSRFPAVTSVPVTVGMPPAPDGGNPPSAEPPRVNLFLYRVSENGFLKNQEIPGRGSRGAYGHPPLSLELHYLLTTYGTTSEGDVPSDAKLAHDLFGNAMRVLHDYPVVAEELVRQRVSAVGTPILDLSLLGEFEQVKLHLSPVSLEDLTKVWTALEQPYRVSAAYLVSVVQIESKRPRRYPRPVGEPPAAGPRIFAVPFRTPQIDEIRVKRFDDPTPVEHPYPYARVGDTLVLIGGGFAGDDVRVRIGGLDVPVTPIADTRIEVVVPDAVIGSAPIPPDRRLSPGACAVSANIGVVGLPQTGFPSNHAVIMVVPYVGAIVPSLNTTPRTIQVQGKRLFDPSLTGEALIGRVAVAKADYVNPSETQFNLVLPDSLPSTGVRCLLSGNLTAFPMLGASGAIDVQIAADGPHTIGFSAPATIDDAAQRLQGGIRGAASAGNGFRSARVGVARDATSDRLVFIAGGLHDTVTIAPSMGDPAATQLKLTGGQSTQVDGYLSGELVPFPVLSSAQPQLVLTIGAISQSLTLAGRPMSLGDAAAQLQTAIRAASGAPEFAGAFVLPIGTQLLVVPGTNQPVTVSPAVGVDTTTVIELQLSAPYLVRTRVNGAESIDLVTVTLP
jgi:hypothetical protein